MAKNIVINVDNSLAGTVELWASAPMVNGTRQTAPVFLTEKPFEDGTVTLSGLQETPADQSWHYRIIVRPAGRECGSKEGSAQFRVFLPTSLSDTTNLTALPSAWAWTQNGVNYAWLDTPDNSTSVKLVDGVGVARNVAPDPKALNPANFRSTGTLTAEGADGSKVTMPSGGSAQVVIDKQYGDLKVGDVFDWSFDVKVTSPTSIIPIVLFYGGANEDTNAIAVPQTPADGWVRHRGTSTVTAAPAGGYLNFRIHNAVTPMPAGEGFYFTKLMLQKNTQEPYFDGSM